jgi:hypothetical protein
MVTAKCSAKDPSTCPYHGNRQLGVKAEATISEALANKPVKYYLTDEELKTTPLKKMSATALALSVQQFAREEGLDEAKITDSINMAAHLHRKDLRSNRGKYPKTPYIEHPLRNTVRLIRLGCKDQATLITSVLHDTVEDHPFEISKEYAGVSTRDESEARKHAFNYIAQAYGEETKSLVQGMSNDLIDKDTPVAEKNAAYVSHVSKAIENPKVCAAKVADLIDNAVGLYHNLSGAVNGMPNTGIARRANKYLLVWDDVESRLKRDVFERRIPVSDAGLQEMIDQFDRGRERLHELAKLS